MKNNKGFTLIELIMVTIILGILAAVAIPRYMTTVAKAEEAVEDEVISSITSGLEMFATEKLIDNGRRSWPTNPFDALETKPSGYTTDVTDADNDDEWTFNTTNNRITHQRQDDSRYYWTYDSGKNYEGSGSPVNEDGTGWNQSYGGCVDDPNWVSIGNQGWTCENYTSYAEAGLLTEGDCNWNVEVGLQDACCVCGGGYDNNVGTGTGIGTRTPL